MELLDRYLEAVKRHLPWQRQDDIIAELRANLEAQLEDKEAELGRPLTEQETEAWLKQLGSPIQVAARYKPHQYLIGPNIFPIYWYVLRLVFLWATAIYGIVSVIEIASSAHPSIEAAVQAVLRVPEVLLSAATWVTLIFAVLEYVARRYPEKCPPLTNAVANWEPGSLPPLDAEVAEGKKPRSYARAVAEVVFGFLFLLWFALVPKYPLLWLGPGALYLSALPYRLAPVWIPFYWCVLALNSVQLAWNTFDLFNGRWQRLQPVKYVAFQAIGLIPLLLLVQAPGHALVTLKHPAQDQATYGAVLANINHSIYLGFLIVIGIVAMQLAWRVIKVSVAAYRKRVAA